MNAGADRRGASASVGPVRAPGGFPVVGIIGGGQLARMCQPPAVNLGITLSILAEGDTASAALVTPSSPVGQASDVEAVRAFARHCDVVTFDHEHIPEPVLDALAQDGIPTHPRPEALRFAQDKLAMRELMSELGIGSPRWARVRTPEELEAFGAQVGWPVVLKTPRGGYDGKGVLVVGEGEAGTGEAAAWFDAVVDPDIEPEAHAEADPVDTASEGDATAMTGVPRAHGSFGHDALGQPDEDTITEAMDAARPAPPPTTPRPAPVVDRERLHPNPGVWGHDALGQPDEDDITEAIDAARPSDIAAGGAPAELQRANRFPDGLLAEEAVPFTRELAILVARSPSGQAAAWPVVETVQTDGICTEVLAPAPGVEPEEVAKITEAALRIAGRIGLTGVMAVELFEVSDVAGATDGAETKPVETKSSEPEAGTQPTAKAAETSSESADTLAGLLSETHGSTSGVRYLVNELAMRPHNSGHWTIDGAVTSQFEQHLRAVLDLPLGDPSPRARWTVMGNVLGGEVPEFEDLYGTYRHLLARDPGLKVHLYGKGVRPGRKIGHVNVSGDDLESLRERATHATGYLRGTVRE